MKKDNFISIGIVFYDESDARKIIELHDLMESSYNYFEILILDFAIDVECKKRCDDLIKSITNARIIKLSNIVDVEIAHTILIENCIGDFCCIADLEHEDIKDIIGMLDKAETFDIAMGRRERKVQTIFESMMSKLFYKIVSIFTGVKLNSMHSDFFVINKKVINHITKNEDKVKFLRLIKLNNGFSKCDYLYMPIGKENYKRTFLQNVNFTIDIIVNYSNRLIRTATILSLFASTLNLFYILYVLISYILNKNVASGWTSSNLYTSFTFFILFLVLAILGEHIRIIIQNQKNTPLYEISDEKSSLTLFSSKKNVDKE